MRQEKKVEIAKEADYINAGVPEVWIPALQKMNLLTIEQLKGASPNKIFNDLGGMRKKLKIDAKMPTLDEVTAWVS